MSYPRNRPRSRASLLVVLVALGLSAGACSSGGSSSPTASAGTGVVTQIPTAQREALEPVTGHLIDGGTIDSRDLAGRVVVYNVWGSWCPPCRKEAPDLRRVANRMHDDGVRFVGLDVRDNDTAARAFVRNFEIPYPSITSSDSAKALLLFSSLPPNAVPSTVVVDRNGRVAARVIGPTTYSTLHGLVQDVLERSTGEDARAS